jgi:hypothetical protein
MPSAPSPGITAGMRRRPAPNGHYARVSVALRRSTVANDGGRRRRRGPSALFRLTCVLLLACVSLSGCPAKDRTAVGANSDGVPVIDNCGTWIGAVKVTDADTGRVIWSAHATKGNDDGVATRGEVTVGQLPTKTWVEDSGLAMEPRPRSWRFDVDATTDAKIVVPDAGLNPTQVWRQGGKSQSIGNWNDTKCSSLPISLTASRIILLGMFVVAGGAAAAIVIKRRRATTFRAPGKV